MNTFAVDYETFYSKEYGIGLLGNYKYVHDPQFDAYLLSVVGDNGYEWVGNPKDFDWSVLQNQIVIAHNAGFEQAVTTRLVELGIAPDILSFAALYDTADLAAYLGVPRNLAGAVEHLFKTKLSKSTRDKAKGKHWKEFTPAFQAEMRDYGLADSKWELKIWKDFNHLWPEDERLLSELTREMCNTGFPVDVSAVEKAIKTLEFMLWKVRSQIPWGQDLETKPLSPKAVAAECRKHGIEPPKSMAKDSEDFAAWLKDNGDALPWAKAIGQYRSINAFLKKMQTMRIRTKEDGWMPFGLKYAGAHTLRDSGDSGFNPQNLPREPLFLDLMTGLGIDDPDYAKGLDIRGMITAPDGYLLGVADLRAIEPCTLAVFAEDWELVERLKDGMDIYEAWERTHGGYTDPLPLKEVDPKRRFMAKTKVLGLGYGAGPDKYIIIAKTLGGIDLPYSEASSIVQSFRATKKIPALWNKLEQGMRNSRGQDYFITLPKGRQLRYRKVQAQSGLSAEIPRTGKMMRLKFWGGALTENLVQATARDIFMDCVLRLHEVGIPPILRVHDEAICIFKEDTAEQDLKLMIDTMSTPPQWMPELPISAEGHLCKKYSKG